LIKLIIKDILKKNVYQLPKHTSQYRGKHQNHVDHCSC